MTTRILVLTIAIMAVTSCSADPASTDEYQALERELAALQQTLAETTAERDALAVQASSPASATDPMTELPSEATAVLEGYEATLLDADGQAMLEYVTDDFTFLSYGTEVQERDYRSTYVTRNYANFKVDQIGDSMVLGDDDTLIVSIPERATTPAVAHGFSTIRLVKVDGEWLIDTHRFTGE